MDSSINAALEKLFACPNWGNRCGPWKDICEAMQQLYAAYRLTTDQEIKDGEEVHAS